MKKIYLTVVIVITALTIHAQDIIVKNDKTEVKSKIEELTETTIKYKKWEMLDGPSYNISKRDVFMIIYKNGTKEYIETTGSQPAVVQNQPVQDNRPPTNGQNKNSEISNNYNMFNTNGGHEEIKFIKKGRYSFQGVEIEPYHGYYDIFNKFGYTDLTESFKASIKAQNKINIIWGGVGGIGLLASAFTRGNVQLIGLGLALSSLFVVKPYKPYTSIVSKFNARANKKISFNSQLNIKPAFAFGNKSGQVGLNIGF